MRALPIWLPHASVSTENGIFGIGRYKIGRLAIASLSASNARVWSSLASSRLIGSPFLKKRMMDVANLAMLGANLR